MAVVPFGPNYIYAADRQLVSGISYVAAIILTACTISALFSYCINGISGCKSTVDVNKLWKLFLFIPDNIFINTIEATT